MHGDTVSRSIPAASHYETLGVSEHASIDAIRAAYRKAVQRCHPDKFQDDPQAEALFKEITAAYKVLRDPEARRAYNVDLGLGTHYPIGLGAEREGLSRNVDAESLRRLEIIAALQAERELDAPRIASRLIAEGCPYQLAWHLAWQAHRHFLAGTLDEYRAGFGGTPAEDPLNSRWQDARDRHRGLIRGWLDRVIGHGR